jgi:hypothetical protein
MRSALFILLWCLLVVACGTEETKEEFGLCSDATVEEQACMWQVYDAFLELGHELGGCVFFVRSPDQEILEGTTWAELPTKYRVEARNAAEGWRGWYHDGVAYVRRYGEAEPFLESLLIHELAHSVGFQHGPEMAQFEGQVRRQIHG